jgi:hypothetical protein
MCVICVLCLIVVQLPPGKTPFEVKINNNNVVFTNGKDNAYVHTPHFIKEQGTKREKLVAHAVAQK